MRTRNPSICTLLGGLLVLLTGIVGFCWAVPASDTAEIQLSGWFTVLGAAFLTGYIDTCVGGGHGAVLAPLLILIGFPATMAVPAMLLTTQRSQHKRGLLTPEQNRQLKSPGVQWKPNTAAHAWMEMYGALARHARKHGDPHVPARFAPNQRLANWVWTGGSSLRRRTGFADPRWMDRYQALIRYASEHGGDARVPSIHHDRSLVNWVWTQRRRRENAAGHSRQNISGFLIRQVSAGTPIGISDSRN